jgi:quercetin dioxygenase-like cupin family protein
MAFASMSRRGQVSENPVTGERAVMLTDPEEHQERVLVSHLYVKPGGHVAAEHFHPVIKERFHVLSGQIGFLIDGREQVLGAGESAEIPVGARHDWWQVGDEEAQAVVEVDPGDRFVEMVGTIFGLARDGKTDDKGLPRPLQLAVTASAYRDVVVFTSPPPALQRAMFAVLGPLGRALGRRASYPEYMSSDEVVEPAPEALALLTDDGRLRG